MTANPLRGEVAFDYEGETRLLRPSFAALAAIENEFGSILQLAQDAADGRTRVEEVAAVFHHCLLTRDGEARPSPAAIGDRLVDAGLSDAFKTYRTLLERILSGVGGG